MLLLSLLLPLLSRASGGGLYAHYLDKKGVNQGIAPFNLTWLPEAVFSILLGYLAGLYWDDWLLGATSALWIYVWFQSGHGTFYLMAGYFSSNLARIQTIERIIRPIYKLQSRYDITHPAYSWACMGFKGAMIALPFGATAAVANAILWPLAYHIGNRLEGRNEVSEYLSAAFLAAVISTIIQS